MDLGYLSIGRFRYWLCISRGTLDIHILGELGIGYMYLMAALFLMWCFALGEKAKTGRWMEFFAPPPPPPPPPQELSGENTLFGWVGWVTTPF